MNPSASRCEMPASSLTSCSRSGETPQRGREIKNKTGTTASTHARKVANLCGASTFFGFMFFFFAFTPETWGKVLESTQEGRALLSPPRFILRSCFICVKIYTLIKPSRVTPGRFFNSLTVKMLLTAWLPVISQKRCHIFEVSRRPRATGPWSNTVDIRSLNSDYKSSKYYGLKLISACSNLH